MVASADVRMAGGAALVKFAFTIDGLSRHAGVVAPGSRYVHPFVGKLVSITFWPCGTVTVVALPGPNTTMVWLTGSNGGQKLPGLPVAAKLIHELIMSPDSARSSFVVKNGIPVPMTYLNTTGKRSCGECRHTPPYARCASSEMTSTGRDKALGWSAAAAAGRRAPDVGAVGGAQRERRVGTKCWLHCELVKVDVARIRGVDGGVG